jgi:hypothetical protein
MLPCFPGRRLVGRLAQPPSDDMARSPFKIMVLSPLVLTTDHSLLRLVKDSKLTAGETGVLRFHRQPITDYPAHMKHALPNPKIPPTRLYAALTPALRLAPEDRLR